MFSCVAPRNPARVQGNRKLARVTAAVNASAIVSVSENTPRVFSMRPSPMYLPHNT